MAKNKKINKSSISEVSDSELQMLRLVSWSAYNDFLKATDKKLLAQFQKTIRHLQIAFWMNVIMSGTTFILAIISLILGFELIFKNDEFSKYMGIGLSIFGLAILFIVLYRSPINNVRHSSSNLAKISFILMGYVRQLNQIDMAYKQVLFSSSFVDPKEMRKTIQSIQEVVEQSVDEVIRSLEKMTCPPIFVPLTKLVQLT